MWIHLSTLPTGESAYSLFSAESTVASPAVMPGPQQTTTHFQLLLMAEGVLKFYSNAADSEVLFVPFPNSKIRRGRWTHLTLVWYPRTGSHPNLRTSILPDIYPKMSSVYVVRSRHSFTFNFH